MIIAKSPTSLQVTKTLFSSEAPENISKECFKNAFHNTKILTIYVADNFFFKLRPSTPKKLKRSTKYRKHFPKLLKYLVCDVLFQDVPNKKKYKPRRWRGHAYHYRMLKEHPRLFRVERHALHLFGLYHLVFKGKIYPTRATLAKELDIHENTLDKALKRLVEWGALEVRSGKGNYTSNTYILAEGYQNAPTSRPEDFKTPSRLWHMLKRLINKETSWAWKQRMHEHVLKDIVHHFLRKGKIIRAFLDRKFFNSRKSQADPPKKGKSLVLWHLLQRFKLSYKDQAILSRYGEGVLRPAINDLEAYLSWGKEIQNKAAFLVSRCKYHLEKMQQPSQEQTPETNLEWIKKQLVDNPAIQVIQSEKDINRREDQSTYAKILIHRESPGESLLFFWKKIHGHWIDKRIPLKHERFREVVKEFIEEPKWKNAG